MPTLAARACSHPGCPSLVRGRGKRFCPAHQSEEWKRQDESRGSATARGYNAQWREIRDRFLVNHPQCAQCGGQATAAHHVVRKRDGGSDDESNLIALCTACHSRVHAVQGESFGHGDEKRKFAGMG